MSRWSRLANVLRGSRLNREIDEELASHLADAIEHGRDPAEARRAFGASIHHRENARDVRLVGWLDSLRADTIFGWRQLRKKKVASVAAVLSLGLAIGALLLRPLPVANADRLYSLYHDSKDVAGNTRTIDTFGYPLFRAMRAAVHDQAELIAISYTYPMDVAYGSAHELEKAPVQFVSGWMFESFGLRPAASAATRPRSAAPSA